MKYSINLIRDSGDNPHRTELFEHMGFIFTNICYIILFLLLGYTGQKFYHFQSILSKEKILLDRLNIYSEGKEKNKKTFSYQNLKQLQSLERDRVLWSVYMDTLLNLLPNNFLITEILYQKDSLVLSGTGKVPLKKDPVKPIEDLISALNQTTKISRNFTKLVLKSIAIESNKTTSVTHFVLTAHNKNL